MPCKGICHRLPGALTKSADYESGWWCKGCERSFTIGPRCRCCNNLMRAANRRNSNPKGKLPMELRPNVIILDASVRVWRPVFGSCWEINKLAKRVYSYSYMKALHFSLRYKTPLRKSRISSPESWMINSSFNPISSSLAISQRTWIISFDSIYREIKIFHAYEPAVTSRRFL